jgi:Tfp pilus assembly protein PilX
MIKLNLRKKRGVILIAYYLVVIVLSILGSAFLIRSVGEKLIAERERDFIQAFWLAEAGIDRTAEELHSEFNSYFSGSASDFTWFNNLADNYSGPPQNVNLGEGTYSVQIEDVDVDTSQGQADVTLAATGTVNNMSRVLKSVIRYELTPSSIFNYVMVTESNLELEDIGTRVTGDIHSNSDIEIEDVEVIGTGTAVGTITIEGTGSFTESYEGADALTIPDLNMTDYQSRAGYTYSNDWTITGTFNISDYSSNGIIYIDGKFKAESATIVGPGTIVVTEEIRLEDNTTVGALGAMVGLFSNSSDSEHAVQLEADSDCYTIIFAPNGGVEVETDSSLYGSIVANSARVETGGALEYTDASSDVDLPSSVKFSTSCWYEQ